MTINTTRWRSHPQNTRLHVYFSKPAVVFSRRVNQTSFSYPISQLTIDNPDGSPTTTTWARPDMTIAVYSSTGTFKGFTRLRREMTLNPTTIDIAETSQGMILFADNDRLDVLEDFRLWPRIPRQLESGVMFKDYNEAVGEHVTKFDPISTTGGPMIGFVDPVEETLNVAFYGDTSYAVGSSPIALHDWVYHDGTEYGGTDENPLAYFPAGERWVRHEVYTDDDMGAHGYTLVVALDNDSYSPDRATVERISGSIAQGRTCSLLVLEQDFSSILPGTQVIVWADEVYRDTPGFVNGPPGREHIRFVGWITDTLPEAIPGTGYLRITAVDAAVRLSQITAFSQALENLGSSKKSWLKQKDFDWWKGFLYSLRWHTTATTLLDVHRPSFYDDYPQQDVALQGSTVWEQLVNEAWAISCHVAVDRLGSLHVTRHPQVMTSSERAAVTPTLALGPGDVRAPVSWQESNYPRLFWVRGGGFTTGRTGRAPKLALAPGGSPDQGTGTPAFDRKLFQDQTELNERIGMFYAWQNQTIQTIPLTLLHQGVPLDYAWGNVLSLTLPADLTKNRRGFDAALVRIIAQEWVPDPVSGTFTETLQVEPLATGAPGSTLDVPTGQWEDWEPPDVPPDWYKPPLPPAGEYGDGLGSTLAAFNRYRGAYSDRGIVVTTTALGTADWSYCMNGLPEPTTGLTFYVRFCYPDLFDPSKAWLAVNNHNDDYGSDGVIFLNSDWRNGGTWTPVVRISDLTPYGLEEANLNVQWMVLSPTEPGLAYALIGTSQSGFDEVRVLRISDYGSTLEFSPQLRFGSGQYTNKFAEASMSMACGVSNSDRIIVAGSKQDIQTDDFGVWTAVWGTWPGTDGYWENSFQVDSGPYNRSLHLAFKKVDGSNNNDSQVIMFHDKDGESADRIDISNNYGVGWTVWSTAGGPSPTKQDCGEIAVESGELAYFIRANQIWFAASSPSSWSQYDSPYASNPNAGLYWLGGWPMAIKQFYLGGACNTNEPLVYYTLDVTTGTFVDCTRNLWTLLTPPGSQEPWSAWCIRMTPYWLTED